jgi:hypothetical protein
VLSESLFDFELSLLFAEEDESLELAALESLLDPPLLEGLLLWESALSGADLDLSV